ncbi:MAG: ribokinase [Clostridia bacterium]|nr:ribokinase [Clostridia bacterium]
MLIPKRILTVSSANMDFVMSVSKIPQGGETQLESGTYQFVPGGKGANSAVAVRRLGGDSVFCCRLGKDANGSIMHNIYKKEGLDTRFIVVDPDAVTGLGAIMVEPNGQNRIILFPGANVRLTKEDIDASFICRPDALLMQLEITQDAVMHAAWTANEKNIPIILDAGPANRDFPLADLPPLEIFSPNETETEIFTGINPTNPDNCLRAAMALQKLVSAKYYVIKLGGRGCYIYDGKYYHCLPAYGVNAVDTTAAGDAFTAALTLEYLRSGDIVRAGRYANVVGALAVSKKGALPSLPTDAMVNKFIAEKAIRL